MIARYLTHPQVALDPHIDVTKWALNPAGTARVAALVGSPALHDTTRIITSAELKAIETANPIATALDLTPEVRGRMHENDRSATGFLPPDEFEAVADAFFAHPNTSIRGWETARDAQTRIVAEVEQVLASHTDGDILFTGHGAVGTLLYCHWADLPISRAWDQKTGGGNYFTLDLGTRRPLHPWRPMEDLITLSRT